uniref:Putative secreted protein n=1 Tax=Anopheles darlingi TaxID=43151 RepID=A0A2M4DK58_ANODA
MMRTIKMRPMLAGGRYVPIALAVGVASDLATAKNVVRRTVVHGRGQKNPPPMSQRTQRGRFVRRVRCATRSIMFSTPRISSR